MVGDLCWARAANIFSSTDESSLAETRSIHCGRIERVRLSFNVLGVVIPRTPSLSVEVNKLMQRSSNCRDLRLISRIDVSQKGKKNISSNYNM